MTRDLPATSRPDTLYTAFLAAMAFLQLVGAGMMWMISRLPNQTPQAVWAVQMASFVGVCLFLFEVAVIVVRVKIPEQRKWPTFVLNLVLLLAVPLGTALGIYGLWKVDKPSRHA